jgi:hypothetical protein
VRRFYGLVRLVIDLLVLRGRCDRSKDAEILVLRHQLAVLLRQIARPRFEPVDRATLAALARVARRDRWSNFLLTPATLPRWHRRTVEPCLSPADTSPPRGMIRLPSSSDVERLTRAGVISLLAERDWDHSAPERDSPIISSDLEQAPPSRKQAEDSRRDSAADALPSVRSHHEELHDLMRIASSDEGEPCELAVDSDEEWVQLG